jgi:hypothetical protein
VNIDKIKIGKRVAYRSRKNTGRGKVTDIYTGETGAWVKIHDNNRDVVVTVRPSQVDAY